MSRRSPSGDFPGLRSGGEGGDSKDAGSPESPPPPSAPRRSPRSADARRKAGARAEQLVESCLVRSGWFPLARNHRCPQGEVDLVMAHGPVVVFVEVRERRSGGVVDALSSVTRAKQRRVVRAAMDYAMRAGLTERALRFDVVAVTRRAAGDAHIEHVENAFDASVLEDGHER